MLRAGVIGSRRVDIEPCIAQLVRLGAVFDSDERSGGIITVHELADLDPRSVHIVIGSGDQVGCDTALADVWLTGGVGSEEFDESLSRLWHQRLVRWEENLATGSRAPRRRRAQIVEPDPTWAGQAERLIGRLEYVLGDLPERIDHIGSTSVPGLPAKDLIDIQVVAADLDMAASIALAATGAGFVGVPGAWFGPGNEGRAHREEVCVDADPGRPVNVNIRPFDSPVWRDALAFRDWLRSSGQGRAEYAALKRALADRTDLDIDGYGNAKATWVSSALARATEETRAD